MKFSVATVLAFVAAVMARPAFTNLEFNVVEGKPFTLTWNNAEGKIVLELMSGPDEDSLKPLRTLANLPAGSQSFEFTPSNLPSGNYAFRITDESSGPEPFNYTKLIPYTGTGTVSSSTSASASTTGSVSRTSTAASSTATETETETTTNTATGTTTTGTQSTTATGSVTTTLRTTTTTGTSTTASRSPTGTPPPNTNNGQRFASSLALVFGTVAALVFFN